MKVYRGGVYYVDFSPNIGSEQGGIRPAVVIQNDIGNKYSPTTIVAPISTKNVKYKKQETHVHINVLKNILPNSIILLEQIKTIDASRIREYICGLSNEEMRNVDKAIMVSLGIKNN